MMFGNTQIYRVQFAQAHLNLSFFLVPFGSFFKLFFWMLFQQQLDETMRIPKETIDIIKDQVFGFDTFFVTTQEPYEVIFIFHACPFFKSFYLVVVFVRTLPKSPQKNCINEMCDKVLTSWYYLKSKSNDKVR